MTIQQEEQALQSLKEFSKSDPDATQILIDILNKNGVFTDIGHYAFNIKVAEHWSKECTDYLRQLGYNGSDLNTFTKYYGESTPGPKYYSNFSDFFYVLYNMDVWGEDIDIGQRKAEEMLDSKVEDWMASFESEED